MEKIWLKSYPDFVPETIDPAIYDNLADILHQTAKKFPENKGVTCLGGSSWTFKQLESSVNRLAAYLQQELHLKKGDRLAIMLPNTPQYLIALFAALKNGLIVVNINPLYTPSELAFQLNDSGAKAILILENFAHTLEKALPEVSIERILISRLGDLLPAPKRWIANFVVKYIKRLVPSFSLDHIPLREALQRGKPENWEDPGVKREDTAFYQYTGGTTGVPKAAVLTHNNVIANVLQGGATVAGVFPEGNCAIVLPLPMYHIYALTMAFYHVSYGIEDIMIVNPRDLGSYVKELKNKEYIGFIGLNTLFHGLVNYEPFRKMKFPKFYTIAGGMTVKPSVAKEWKKVTGSTIVEGYGLTETSPIVTINRIDLEEFNGTIGLPVPSVDVEILDEEGKPVPRGGAGELCVKGPNVMKEYKDRPDETANVFTEDGWLRTGDIVKMKEDGTIKILDRKKDVIIVSGFNVYPNEVEEVLLNHPGVHEAAVVGEPEEHSGERVKAYIVKGYPDLTEDQILSHCYEYLTHYKCPHTIVFKDELPKSAVGKVLRRQLR